MVKIVECIPNISEGRRLEVVEEILDEVRQVAGVTLLDYSSNADHNRTVISMIGEPEKVLEAAWRLIVKAAEKIDLDQHQGEHPRMGATDVVPFVPVRGMTMDECVELAKRLGERVGRELSIPVYLYEKAATRPERRNLADVRRGQYEGLKESVKTPERTPDFGPSVLGKAGAIAVGARPPLVAFNVNLGTTNLEIGKAIAKGIRGSSGGFVNVKALGIDLSEQGMIQISMNMVDTQGTPLYRAMEFIKTEAAHFGVPVIGSEIVGLVPLDAMLDAATYYLKLHDFSSEQILEKRVFGF
ncbi:glutamate formiminotransferase [Desulfosporosinus acidiphilus SJ4]|uniref:glutamate formimidoyltransferase n=1 Tax=Desulfosporosinus acidiphilus (strain DSM 22704 / JCM 16185 / SJ4) TaxID=646529 RepID=I4DBA9_DESAJ|nr:glutamate formimidoyltransferase [Desulfosporosinus acidiphilus]AFM43083.1 glutamate formiminotransferase [Desulfosporosinus acidiphilus SJ4]